MSQKKSCVHIDYTKNNTLEKNIHTIHPKQNQHLHKQHMFFKFCLDMGFTHPSKVVSFTNGPSRCAFAFDLGTLKKTWISRPTKVDIHIHYEKKCFAIDLAIQFLSCKGHLQLIVFILWEC